MPNKIQFKRGLEANLPNLTEGEPGFTTDSKKLFVGSNTGNVQFAKQSAVDGIQQTLDTLKTVDANAEMLDARGTYPVLGERLDDVTSQLADNATKTDGVVSVKDKKFGAKGDYVSGTGIGTDDTASFQSAIDFASANNIGKVLVPSGTYLIKGTITLRKNVTVEGFGDINLFTDNAGGVNYNDVVIYHKPTTSNVDLFVTDVPHSFGYISGIGLKKLNLYGTTNSRSAVVMDNAAHLIIDSLVISNGFTDGIVGSFLMHTSINKCYITAMKNTPLRIKANGNSTTVTVNECYLRGSKWAAILEQSSIMGITFNDCVFESCTDGGVDIGVDNKVYFNNPYVENIPSAKTASSIFQIGVNGTPGDPNSALAHVTINGGLIQGYADSHTDSSIFNCDRVAVLTVTGTQSMFAGKYIKTTANTKLITMISPFVSSISDITGAVFDKSKVLFIGFNNSYTAYPKIQIPKIEFTDRGKWSIFETFAFTDGDLIFSLSNVGDVLRMDNLGNLKHTFSGLTGDLSRFVDVPATSTSPGKKGDWSADSFNLYVCHATNTWKRVGISSW